MQIHLPVILNAMVSWVSGLIVALHAAAELAVDRSLQGWMMLVKIVMITTKPPLMWNRVAQMHVPLTVRVSGENGTLAAQIATVEHSLEHVSSKLQQLLVALSVGRTAMSATVALIRAQDAPMTIHGESGVLATLPAMTVPVSAFSTL